MRKLLSVSLLLSMVGISGSAMAALPTGLDTAITALETDALAAQGLVWPVFLTIVGGFILFGIVSRALHKVG